MEFALNVNARASVNERHPICGDSGVICRDIVAGLGVQPTFKVYQLYEPDVSTYIPKLWSNIYGSSQYFRSNVNRLFTSETCSRKALLASWRQQYLYDHGIVEEGNIDGSIELMAAAYQDRNDPPILVTIDNHVLLARIPVTAYYLDGRFYLVQKL